MPALPAMLCLATLLPLCAACASMPAGLVRVGDQDPGERIGGIDLCQSDSPGVVSLDPAKAVILLVHGCTASGGRFRALAHVLQANGQQAVCFNYDDRDSIEGASAHLIAALDALKKRLSPQRITVLAHSQGGLVARRAFVRERRNPLRHDDGFSYRLLTVSTPFGGINASRDCGKTWLHVVTLGITALICQVVAGDKWSEIPPESAFMQQPGTLVREVQQVIKVTTDERGSCRRYDAHGDCAVDDFVFSLGEQHNPTVDSDPRLMVAEVRAGHVEIVGSEHVTPIKLVRLLRQHGILMPTPPERRAAVAQVLRHWY
jgi:pimeloyl-ACP methyl ester carboxylesterase